MLNVPEIGSRCDVVIQGKYPLFSEAHFDKILTDDKYERQIDTQNNNQTYYRKDDIIIFTDFPRNTITFRLFNTISIQTKYAEFTKLLAKLSFKSEHILTLGGNFYTFVTGNGNPQIFLNKFFDKQARSVLSTQLKIQPSIFSIVFSNPNVPDVDIQVRLEPLASSPQDSLYVEFAFRTTKYDIFNEFISKFGADFIQDTIKSINDIK